MASNTRTAIRQRAGAYLDPHWRSGTVRSGTLTTLVDHVVLDTGSTSSLYKGGYVLRYDTPSTTTLSDSFVRADSAVSIGSADTGGAWTVVSGTWGISGNRGYNVSDVDNEKLTITAAKDGTYAVTVEGVLNSGTAYAYTAPMFRFVDSSNFLFVALINGAVQLRRILAGANSLVETATQTTSDNTDYDLVIQMSGNYIRILVDGTVKINHTLVGINSTTYNVAGATKIGFTFQRAGAAASDQESFVDLTFKTGVVADDRERVISGFAGASGTVTVAQSYNIAPMVGENYETWSAFRPTEVEAAINRALKRMRFIEETTITGVSNQRQYSLAAYTWIESPNQIIDLRLRSEDSANEYLYVPQENWWISEDAGVLTLNLSGTTYVTADDLILRSVRDYADVGTLSVDTSTTTAPLEWVVWETIWDVLQRQAWRSGRDGAPQIDRQLREAQQKVRELRLRYKPDEPARPLMAVVRGW